MRFTIKEDIPINQKRCRKCKIVKDISLFYKLSRNKDGLYSYCKSCENARLKIRDRVRIKIKNPIYLLRKLKSQKRYRLLNPQKTKARLIVNKTIKRGILTRKPCEKCGKEKSEAHHEDYNKPLEIVWLCKKHHTERHYY